MRICVYGAASNSIDDIYISETEKLGREIAKHGHDLVYGAGANGVMGAVARGCHEGGADIVGVVPKFFNVDGIIYSHCNELIRPDTMRERKQIMEDRADAFVIAPGGIGTFEEFFEILTLKQLSRHEKPIAVFNLNGYYDSMQAFIQNAIDQGFLKKECFDLYKLCGSVDEIFDYFDNYVPVMYSIFDLKDIK